MLHNGVSSKAPYYDEAVRVEVQLFGQAFIWSPAGTDEQWLIPGQWVIAETSKKTGKVLKWTVNQDGAIGGRLISLPGDSISVVK